MIGMNKLADDIDESIAERQTALAKRRKQVINGIRLNWVAVAVCALFMVFDFVTFALDTTRLHSFWFGMFQLLMLSLFIVLQVKAYRRKWYYHGR